MSRYRFIEAEKADHSVSLLCRVVGVSRSGYYAWVGRPLSARSRCDEALTDWIEKIHERSRGTYGAPRVHAELEDEFGVRCGRKRVARLMREAGLEGCHRRKAKRTTRRDPATAEFAPDLVRRGFASPAPDRLWVADITYVPTRREGFLYLAFVLDVFSRRVVGWSMANHPRARLVIDALEMAILRRRPARGLIHHSDRGSQYTSVEFGSRLEEVGLLPSMGSVADPYDNAMAESFVATLKCELLHGSSWPTGQAARTAIFEYIEGFYNPRRRHSSLGYLSPADYERGKLGEAMVA